jgi:hypothetical protein
MDSPTSEANIVWIIPNGFTLDFAIFSKLVENLTYYIY